MSRKAEAAAEAHLAAKMPRPLNEPLAEELATLHVLDEPVGMTGGLLKTVPELVPRHERRDLDDVFMYLAHAVCLCFLIFRFRRGSLGGVSAVLFARQIDFEPLAVSRHDEAEEEVHEGDEDIASMK